MKEKKLVEQIEEKFQDIEMLEDEYNQLLNITRDGKLRIFEWSGGEFSIRWKEGDTLEDLEDAGAELEVLGLEDEDDIEGMLDDIASDIGGLTDEQVIEEMEAYLEELKSDLKDLLDEK
jgi:hypothetical protein